jgi:hypothetical protein
MKRIAVIFAVLICLLMFLTAQMRAQDSGVTQAITQAALDYMDGAHSGDAARMTRAVHPELHKVSLQFIPQTKTTFLSKAGSSRLIQLIAANAAPLAEDKRNIEAKILGILEGLAVVRVTSSSFWDYLQLADIDGEWKIVNVLWTRTPKPGQAKDMSGEEEAITQTALDYIEGSFTGDAARMTRAVHPELHKVIPVKMPQTGKTRLDKMGAGMLIEGTRAKMGLLAEDKRNIEVTVLDAAQDLAMVRVLSARYYDFLQMAKIDGRWRIINVLWVMNPSALPAKKR